MARKTTAALAFVTLVAAGRAAAQTRPLQTEEATTAPAGRLVLEVGQDAMADEPNFLTGNTRNRFDGPSLRLVWSPADNVEVDVEWVTWIATPDDPDFEGASDFGDVTLRTKLRFPHFSTCEPETAALALGSVTLASSKLTPPFSIRRRPSPGRVAAR